MTDHDGPTIHARFQKYPEPVPRFPVAGIALIGGVCVWAVILWWVLS
jgi:hypothetical protein